MLGFCLFIADLQAQRYTRPRRWEEKAGTWQVCVDAGTSRYLGDLAEDWDFAHLRLGASIGSSIQYRLSDRFLARADWGLYYIYGHQAHTRVWYNNLGFQAINPDFFVGLQFDLLHQDAPVERIPYLFGGAGLTYLNPFTEYKGYLIDLAKLQTEGVAYDRLVGIIRYGLGCPIRSWARTCIGLEISYTHSLSDYLDDVSGTYPDYAKLTDPLAAVVSDRAAEIGEKPNQPGAQRGNNRANDGYYLLKARFCYTLSTHRSRRGR